jgi:thiol-disulfide isomerase/thioredoxin
MIERAALVLVLALIGVALYAAYRRWHVAKIARQAPTDAILAQVQQGTPAIVYFTTEHCGVCKLRQRPALQQVASVTAAQIITVDAAAQPDIAQAWGVLSVPITFVLDRDGRTTHINHGVADAPTLLRQLGAA